MHAFLVHAQHMPCAGQLTEIWLCAFPGAVVALLGSTVLAMQAYAKTSVTFGAKGSALAQQQMGPDMSG
jgi:hypothetical protein